MRRYKFRICVLYVRRARVSVCVCVCACVSVCPYVCAYVVACGWVLPLLHVHSLYDTTMTRLSRLEKGGGALARRRRPNSYSMFARRRFYSLFSSISALSRCRRIDRAILVHVDGPLPFDRPSPKLSQTRNSLDTRLSLVRTLCLRQFFFSFDCKPLFLSNIPLRYSYMHNTSRSRIMFGVAYALYIL